MSKYFSYFLNNSKELDGEIIRAILYETERQLYWLDRIERKITVLLFIIGIMFLIQIAYMLNKHLSLGETQA